MVRVRHFPGGVDFCIECTAKWHSLPQTGATTNSPNSLTGTVALPPEESDSDSKQKSSSSCT